jgi:hypothetical protein
LRLNTTPQEAAAPRRKPFRSRAKLGASLKNTPRSSDQRLQIFGVYLYGSMLVYQFECQYESDAAASSRKSAAKSLHDTP